MIDFHRSNPAEALAFPMTAMTRDVGDPGDSENLTEPKSIRAQSWLESGLHLGAPAAPVKSYVAGFAGLPITAMTAMKAIPAILSPTPLCQAISIHFNPVNPDSHISAVCIALAEYQAAGPVLPGAMSPRAFTARTAGPGACPGWPWMLIFKEHVNQGP